MTQSLGFKLEIFIEKMAKGIWPEPKSARPIRRSLQKRAERRASRAFHLQARRERRKRLEAQAWARRQREQIEAYYVRIAELWCEHLNKQQSRGPSAAATAQPAKQPETATSTQENNGAQEKEGAEESNARRADHESEIAHEGECIDALQSPQMPSADVEYTLPGLPREQDVPSMSLVSDFPSWVGFYSSENYNESVYSFMRKGNVQVLPVPEARDRKRRPIVLTNAYEYYSYVRRLTREERYNGEKLDPFCSPSALLYMVYNGWIELDDVLSWKCGRDALGRGLVEFAGRPDDTTSLIKGTYPTEPEMPMKPSERKVEWFTQKISMHKKSVSATCSKLSDVDDRLFNGPFGEAVKRFATPGVQERVLKELEVVRKGQQVTVQEDWRPLFWVLFRAVYQQHLRSTTVSMPVVAWPAVAPLSFASSLARASEIPVARGAATTASSRRSERRVAKPYSSTAGKRKSVTVEDVSDDDEASAKRRFTDREKGKWKAGAPSIQITITPPTPEPTVESSSSNLEAIAETSVSGKGETTPTPDQTHQIRTVDVQVITPETKQNQDTSSSAPAPALALAPTSIPQSAPTPPAPAPSEQRYQSALSSTGASTTTVANVTEPSTVNNASAAEPSHSFAEDVSMDFIDEPISVTPAPASFTTPSSIVPGGPQAKPIVPVQGTMDGMDTDMSCGFVNPSNSWVSAPQTQTHVRSQPQETDPAFSYDQASGSFGEIDSLNQGASFKNTFQSQSIAGPSKGQSTAGPSGVLPSGSECVQSDTLGPSEEWMHTADGVRKVKKLPPGAEQFEPPKIIFNPIDGFHPGAAPTEEQKKKNGKKDPKWRKEGRLRRQAQQ